jgi:deoxyribodipyrimidine photo-lyase
MQAAGVDASTKLSPFLALGCLSARQVEAAVRRLQAEVRQRGQGGAREPEEQQRQPEDGASGAAAAPAAAGGGAGAGGAGAGGARAAGSGGGGGGPASEACEWLVMHLVIRDFFIFTALKAGDALVTTGTAAFQQAGGGGGGQSKAGGGKPDGGGRGSSSGKGRGGGSSGGGGGEWRDDPVAFQAWASGTTGFPFVDAVRAAGWALAPVLWHADTPTFSAGTPSPRPRNPSPHLLCCPPSQCMRELAATGWMSNRGRQNAASFLAKELGLDWRLGARGRRGGGGVLTPTRQPGRAALAAPAPRSKPRPRPRRRRAV